MRRAHQGRCTVGTPRSDRLESGQLLPANQDSDASRTSAYTGGSLVCTSIGLRQNPARVSISTELPMMPVQIQPDDLPDSEEPLYSISGGGISLVFCGTCSLKTSCLSLLPVHVDAYTPCSG